MHIIIGLLALLGAAAVWYWRIKMAREAGGELLDAARDIRGLVRRNMYKRKYNLHPADQVDDTRLAAAGIVIAIATMDAPIAQSEIDAMNKAARETFDATSAEAEDITHFGRWVADQCNTNGEAVRRLSKVVKKLAGAEALPDLLAMIETVATADGHALGDIENEAIEQIRRTLTPT